jgi:hypothetical protein
MQHELPETPFKNANIKFLVYGRLGKGGGGGLNIEVIGSLGVVGLYRIFFAVVLHVLNAFKDDWRPCNDLFVNFAQFRW